ncbi:Ppx/GppA phosphatase family protein [Streptomyces flaveolus]|uniref:Ppx/GppA phosphatase family protein n=1 Tax=Streptomyces flaveolus TaxID=67297 RepID=UPI0036F84308
MGGECSGRVGGLRSTPVVPARSQARLAATGRTARAELPGISPTRTRQCLTGAVIAHTAMRRLGIGHVTRSPWAVREGVLLTQLREPAARERLGEKPAPLGGAQAGRLPIGVG